MDIKKIAVVATSMLLVAGLTGCGEYTDRNSERNKEQQTVTLKGGGLEKANLTEKLRREEDPNAVRYVYLMNFGDIVGFYVIKGKVSSSGSQIAPEMEAIRTCSTCSERVVVDSKQDDGTYGTGDPGIFFFTSDGTMVATSLDYIEADAPLPIDVPRLGGND
jgi:hypothetical protein